MIKNVLTRYKGIIAYLFFGMCTTMVNFFIYYLCARQMYYTTSISTIIAWIAAVAFAFVSNKIWVFESASWNQSLVVKEFMSFILCRLATGFLDLAIMLFSVNHMGWNDLIMKSISNTLVIILNYLASKLIIFKKKNGNA